MAIIDNRKSITNKALKIFISDSFLNFHQIRAQNYYCFSTYTVLENSNVYFLKVVLLKISTSSTTIFYFFFQIPYS